MGKYFEEFKVGEVFVTPARTITETDVVTFAWISADWNPPHTDAVHASKTIFKERLAHGPLIASATIGLLFRTGILDGTSMALLDMQYKFLGPVLIGDTIRVAVEIAEARPSTTKPDRGVVVFRTRTYNQNDVLVGEGSWPIMMARR
ncbi:MAG: dehydratase [Chloroflexota bacterium]|nr:MAG: dehydratase [Chloroflexota bacterium]